MTERLPFGEKGGALHTPVPGPESRALARRLAAVEAPGITRLADDFPVFWKGASGANVEDVDGNIYVDLTSAFGVASLGHNDRAVAQAVSAQLALLPHGMGDFHPPAVKVELLERLASLFPEPGAQAILATGGAEAVEAALKTAFLATGRPGVIAFDGAYHGLTLGTLAVGGQIRFREPFARQLASFCYRARFPRAQGDRSRERMEKSLREIEQIADDAQLGNTPVGALLLEPIQGRAGVVVPPAGWLHGVRELTRRHGILLIADEILTGFGRTGRRFACDREGVVPDILCVGKALTGTTPLSACIGRREVMNLWPAQGDEALHTSTFLGHPLGCAAALASLAELERRQLAARADHLGREVMAEIRSWQRDLPFLREVRGRGFLIGVALESETPGKAFDVARAALARGVIVLPAGPEGNVVQLSPPLTIGGRQLVWALREFRLALQTLA